MKKVRTHGVVDVCMCSHISHMQSWTAFPFYGSTGAARCFLRLGLQMSIKAWISMRRSAKSPDVYDISPSFHSVTALSPLFRPPPSPPSLFLL